MKTKNNGRTSKQSSPWSMRNHPLDTLSCGAPLCRLGLQDLGRNAHHLRPLCSEPVLARGGTTTLCAAQRLNKPGGVPLVLALGLAVGRRRQIFR
eukprot:391861-Amorphochlora_amoeboformis.AAC.1